MKTIENNIINTTIINKSKFICELIKVNNISDINDNLNIIKNKYKDATHYCYAYIIDNVKRFNDDGEPNGTAGMPILNVLENNDLNHILCIVIRYFGGIKLGTGGLVRAYSNSVTNTLNETKIIELKKGYQVSINFLYENTKNIDHILKDFTIIDKKFDNNVNYIFNVDEFSFNDIKNKLLNYITDINIIEEIYL